jgi:hypothetical protein
MSMEEHSAPPRHTGNRGAIPGTHESTPGITSREREEVLPGLHQERATSPLHHRREVDVPAIAHHDRLCRRNIERRQGSCEGFPVRFAVPGGIESDNHLKEVRHTECHKARLPHHHRVVGQRGSSHPLISDRPEDALQIRIRGQMISGNDELPSPPDGLFDGNAQLAKGIGKGRRTAVTIGDHPPRSGHKFHGLGGTDAAKAPEPFDQDVDLPLGVAVVPIEGVVDVTKKCPEGSRSQLLLHKSSGYRNGTRSPTAVRPGDGASQAAGSVPR